MMFSARLILPLLFVFLAPISRASIHNFIREPEAELRKSIVKLFRHPDLKESVDEYVRISFFVTADKQVVVLKTDSRTLDLDKFIKKRMNYQTVDADLHAINRVYHIKVHFKYNMDVP